MNDAVLRSTRHEVWADVQLLTFCAKLSPDQLQWTAPGTYGAIHNTLHHLVRAQHGYLFRLTGQEDPAAIPLDSARLLPLDELQRMEQRVGERTEALLALPFDPTRVIQMKVGTATAGVILAQFIHHGSDHRAHVGTILGAHDMQPPDLDVWAYGAVIGETPPPSA
jgi:uncharacterized damage-inducible protein DinB